MERASLKCRVGQRDSGAGDVPLVWRDVGRPPSQRWSARRGTWKYAGSCRRPPVSRALCRTSDDAACSDNSAHACAEFPARNIPSISYTVPACTVACLEFPPKSQRFWRFVFQRLPEPNRACLAGVYAVTLDPQLSYME